MAPKLPARALRQQFSCQCLHARTAAPPEPITPSSIRQFHVSHRNETRLRREMWAWLKGPGKAFREPQKGSTNYLSAYDKEGRLLRAEQERQSIREWKAAASDPDLDEDEEMIEKREEAAGIDEAEMERRADDRARRRRFRDEMEARDGIPRERLRDLRPYPNNPSFRSQSVLSEGLREELYQQVAVAGLDLASVSAVYGIDVRRVAAVVRLKTIEKQWIDKDKPLAKPYNDAVLQMLPQTPFSPDMPRPVPHESINDLPVHPWTRQQIFYPTSESRHFTREDAAKVFHESLLPADERIPNKQLIQIQKWDNEGLDRNTRRTLIQEMDAKEHSERVQREQRKADWETRSQVTVSGRRWDFKFTDISAENVGKDGRGRGAVGLRYGMPHEDRKRGIVKIPTSVE